MSTIASIAYLAGVFDGEGCVHVQRSPRKTRSSSFTVYSLHLTIANTSTPLVIRCVSIMEELGVSPIVERETKYTKKPIHYIKVQKKRDALVLAKAILPYSQCKRTELELAILYLERACTTDKYKRNAEDVEILDAISALKKPNAMLPESIKILLGDN
jgi:hypothetical protein